MISLAHVKELSAFLIGFLICLPNLKFSGINFTLYDFYIVAFVIFIAVSAGRMVRLPKVYLLVMISTLLFGSISVLISLQPIQAIQHYIQIVFIFSLSLPVMVTALNAPKSRVYAVRGVCLALALIVCHAFVLSLVGGEDYVGGRLKGFMGDPQMTAFVLALMSPYLLLDLMSNRAGIGVKVLCSIVLGLLVWLLVKTASRSGMVAFTVGTMVPLFFMSYRDTARGAVIFRILSACLTLFFIWVLFIDGSWANNFEFSQKAIERFSAQLEGETLLGGRSVLISDALSTITAVSVFFGIGFESIHLVSESGMKPHNIFILYFLEAGFFFVATLGAFFVYLFIGGARILLAHPGARRLSADDKAILMLSICSISAFMILSFFNTVLLLRTIWLGVAFVLVFLSVNRNLDFK